MDGHGRAAEVAESHHGYLMYNQSSAFSLSNIWKVQPTSLCTMIWYEFLFYPSCHYCLTHLYCSTIG